MAGEKVLLARVGRKDSRSIQTYVEDGGYKALRFIDKTGRECAYYDTTLLSRRRVRNLTLLRRGEPLALIEDCPSIL